MADWALRGCHSLPGIRKDYHRAYLWPQKRSKFKIGSTVSTECLCIPSWSQKTVSGAIVNQGPSVYTLFPLLWNDSLSFCPSHSYFLSFCFLALHTVLIGTYICMYVRTYFCMYACCLRELMRFADGSSSNKIMAVCESSQDDIPVFNLVTE